MCQISIKNVYMSYEKKPVFKNINFEINKGDYLCIVGENGSGKTTLIKGILGLLQLKEGEIIFGDGIKANHIGYLPQQTMIQKDFPASVFEVVLSGCQNKESFLPIYTKNEKQKALTALNEMGIENLKTKSYKEISGGQQQRVLLSRALCATEKILILDEPVAGLDPIITDGLYNIIERLNKNGITVIMITHDVCAVTTYSNKVLHLNCESSFFGEKEEYIKSQLGIHFLKKGENDD